MDDESKTAPAQDTPLIDSAPDEGHAQEPQVDYAKRYNDLRPEFDRTKQQLSNYETQLAAARNGDIDAIRNLGFDVDAPDPTPEYVEETDPYAAEFAQTKKELDELKQWRQAQETERIASGIRSHVDSLAQAEGLELSDYDKEVIFRSAVNGEKIGADETAAAFKAHADYIKGLQEQYSEKPHVPRPGTGQAVEKQPDLDNQQERREWMKAQLGLD